MQPRSCQIHSVSPPMQPQALDSWGRDSLAALGRALIFKGLRRMEWTKRASGARTNGLQLLVTVARRLVMFSSPETLILQARQQFDGLLALVEGAKNERVDRVEGQIFTELLRLGLTLLRQYVAQHGTGDLGLALVTETGTWKRLEDLHSRRYVSIFGELSIDRTVYGTRAKQKIQAVPLDAQLGLPDGDFSYLLQRWLQERCLDSDYAESVRSLATILGVEPSVRSVEEMTRRMAADVPDFQSQQPLPKVAEQAEILVATADHKGVPMVRRDRPTAAADETSERP